MGVKRNVASTTVFTLGAAKLSQGGDTRKRISQTIRILDGEASDRQEGPRKHKVRFSDQSVASGSTQKRKRKRIERTQWFDSQKNTFSIHVVHSIRGRHTPLIVGGHEHQVRSESK